ncbi:MAG: hypothetical protein CFE34_05055 [Rhodobacteraceae bacterium PARR1]|nr:MAG: hypothetical protein CFE34_05055 [Rhodobacteraceae bacterium PARR1]
MRWLLALVLTLMALEAQAQQVSVTTGDHPGFTRVVLEAQGLNGWRLERLSDGYALRLRRPAGFNLDNAFRVITRDRLTGLAPLDDGRGLQLSVGCACHAVGFDYRPGIVVIDLRDGPPPQGSSFELTQSGDIAPPLAATDPTPRPMARTTATWEWTDQALTAEQTPAAPIAAPPVPDTQKLALRDALLMGLSDGAARGLVDPVVRLPPAPRTVDTTPGTARVGLLALPGVVGLSPQGNRPSLTATGAECIEPARIDVPAWGNPDLPATAQLTGIAAFLGEFDRPDPDALTMAVRRHLWLGFGVEAAALVDAFAADSADADLWRGMARAVDGGTDPGGPFAGMTICDGPAALWAALAEPELSPPAVNTQAVLRSFSALPPHLRRSLGPPLTEKFLQSGDQATAQSLRDAMLRGDPGAGALVDARIALRSDNPEQAEAEARAALAEGGPDSAAALVTLIEAQFQARKPVAPADVTAVAALRQEQPDDIALTRATILALALSGAFDEAFGAVETAPQSVASSTTADLWALLAETGPDSALLTHGILAAAPPPTSVETRLQLATRLTGLGFGSAAQVWLGPDGDPVALAAAELAAGDARAALTRLAARPGSEAATIRARALLALGDPTTAADLLAGEAAAQSGDILYARIQARDWDFLRQNGPAPWQSAAAEVRPAPLSGAPLSDGRAILTQSAATRAAITALLEAAPQQTLP